MAELGLASIIIGLAASGVEVTTRMQWLQDFLASAEDQKRAAEVAAGVSIIVHVLHQLPELLQSSQGLSPAGFDTLSRILEEYGAILKSLDSIVETLKGSTRRNRLTWSFAARQYRDQMTSMSTRLERLKSNLMLMVQSVVTLLRPVLQKILILYARSLHLASQTHEQTKQLGQSEQTEQLELSRPDQLLLRTYMASISNRQRQFLNNIAFGPGKNHYIQLQRPPLRTRITNVDTIQAHGCHLTRSGSLSFQEIKDEEVEPLVSLAQDGDQFSTFVCIFSL